MFMKMCIIIHVEIFFGFSMQNHAESYENYARKLFLDPKRAKFNEKLEFGYIQESMTSPGPVQEDKSSLPNHVFILIDFPEIRFSFFKGNDYSCRKSVVFLAKRRSVHHQPTCLFFLSKLCLPSLKVI